MSGLPDVHLGADPKSTELDIVFKVTSTTFCQTDVQKGVRLTEKNSDRILIGLPDVHWEPILNRPNWT